MRISDWSSDVCSSDLGTGRIGERTENVENGARPEFHPAWADVAHGGMVHGCEHEADAGFADAATDPFRADFQIDAERRQCVGCAGFRAEGPVAVLGDRDRKSTRLNSSQ